MGVALAIVYVCKHACVYIRLMTSNLSFRVLVYALDVAIHNSFQM